MTDTTARDRRTSHLATNENLRKSHLARRGRPLVLKGVKPGKAVTLRPAEVLELRIDQTYQREDITSKVNELIHVLREGGIIPDPISVAVRSDGSRYIVDGQQRWWAHVDCGLPLNAVLYDVDSHEAEVTLFHVLNNNHGLTTKVTLKSWPGRFGDLLRDVNTQRWSALCGRLSDSPSSQFNTPIVARGMATVLGVRGLGNLHAVLGRAEMVLDERPEWSVRAVKECAKLFAEVFHDSKDHRARSLGSVALADIAHERWNDVGAGAKQWPWPNESQMRDLRRIKWDKLMPTSGSQWLPTVVEQVRKAWPAE